MKNSTRLAAFALSAALLGALPRAAGAVIRPNAASSPAGTVPSNVNYQGRLVDNGFPVTGFQNVTFRIFDALTGPTNLLQTIGPQQVSVNQGLFSTTIAISTQALAGPLQKFLEVQVGSQVLSPREPLNSVPFALVAKSLEENLAISTVSVGTQLISSGTLAVASIQALNNSTFFTILSNAHMSSSTLTLDGNAATSLTTTGKVGVGTNAPQSMLEVNGNAQVTATGTNAVGLGFGCADGTCGYQIGRGLLDNLHNFNIYDRTSGALRFYIASGGNVGIGTPIPATTLDVNGSAQFGNTGTKSAFSTTGALTMANAAPISLSAAPVTLTGSNGYVTSASSINASAFFGDGANVSNVIAVSVPASGVTPGNFQTGTYNFPTTLGVGVTAPPTKLDVAGSAQFGSTAKSTFTTAGVLQLASPLSTTFGGTGQNFGAAGINTVPFFSAAGVMGTITAGLGATVLRVPNAGGAPAFGAVDLSQTNATTSQLPTSRGGTGQDWSAVARGALPFFNGAGTMTTLPPSTAGMVLQTNGAGADPTWASPSVGGATTLTNGKIWIGSNITNIATERTVTGDISLSNTGVAAITNIPAISGANLTSLTAANISAGTAGINITGNAATVTTNANLTGNVTSVGNATTIASLPAISGAALTSLTAANISAGTAGINISGNAATATTATSATTAARLTSSALAGFIGTAPAALGAAFYCSDCTISAICVSTGTLAGQWSDAAGRATACK